MAKQRIVVVEDNPGTGRAIELMLNSSGFCVERYSSAEFITRWRQISATCLLIDVHLRDVSGIELARHLRTLGCRAPTVFVTAVIDKTVQQQVAELGLALVQKPFSAAQLKGALASACGSDVSTELGQAAF